MQRLSQLIYWWCNLILFFAPVLLVWTVIDTDMFVELIKRSVNIHIQWQTVQSSQWIVVWCLVVGFFGVGYWAIYSLRKAFKSFAAGEWFNSANSLHTRNFAKLLLIQSILTPVLFTASVLVLSFNHSESQKVLAFSFGHNELKGVFIALIFFIISHILVLGHNIDDENKHFL